MEGSLVLVNIIYFRAWSLTIHDLKSQQELFSVFKTTKGTT
jgi:hypothetical protein